ncbi:MAG: aldo/keto reductase [SAR324 cluster bacterium]|nr:aldo/keto reductase [SAR324 cluster bacterium]
MKYQRCGNSGIKLPAISLGLWQNFGGVDSLENARTMLWDAFDAGITHFDLANNYGPPYGSAEKTFGIILNQGLKNYRDELIISSKAGYDMWPGPYGEWGSRKYLIASIDQSLKRTGLEYFDIFYSHRPDPETPLEETMAALDHIVRSGRALYIGISNYNPQQTKDAIKILRKLGTPCLIHQQRYNLFDRRAEKGLFEVLEKEKIGAIAFSPLAQGLLTNKYLEGIPESSRAARNEQIHLQKEDVNATRVEKASQLDNMAKERGQSLAQMALSWVLRQAVVTSVLIGASRSSQIEECVQSLDNLTFTSEELMRIEDILAE